MSQTPREDQLQREALQRQAALGRRCEAIREGSLGPVIKRWINASVAPVSERIGLAGLSYLGGDIPAFCSILDSPIFELQQHDGLGDGSRTGLRDILYWHGRGYGEDLTLAALGTAIASLAGVALRSSRDRSLKDHAIKGVPLTGLLAACGDAARETALGQFFTQVQGAEAMEKIRRPDRSGWSQRKRMNAVGAILKGQVKPQLVSEDSGEVTLGHVGTRTVLKVMTKRGELRQITLRPPTPEDWDLLDVARRELGEADPHRQAWMSYALVVLCAAQVEHGWFDLSKFQVQKTRRRNWSVHHLFLSEEALQAMGKDLDKWVHLGFTQEPMLVPPENGDYLSVKHRAVGSRWRGPMGYRTEAEGTSAWKTASEVLAGTPWKVATGTLQAIKDGFAAGPGGEHTGLYKAALEASGGDLTAVHLILSAYSRDADKDALYFPIYMDFRGRVYPRTHLVTYQGTDLQKGLLRFPEIKGPTFEVPSEPIPSEPIVMHATNLYGNGLDKLPRSARWDWWRRINLPGTDEASAISKAESPIQLKTLFDCVALGRSNTIPCQIDGTCNGLQHLSALFRDETAAPWVNLTGSSYEDTPADIYGKVAEEVEFVIQAKMRVSMDIGAFSGLGLGTAQISPDYAWAARLGKAIKIDRKLCKSPVMVLPYGGTMNAILEGVTKAVLGQVVSDAPWLDCLTITPMGQWVSDYGAIEAGYLAFKDRALADHPLFHADMKKLAGVVHECIKKVIPRAMAAMDAFRAIAGHVGERSLEWATGSEEDALWVVHAYPLSARQTLKTRGFHLPNSVRGLQMRTGKDEIDKLAHRTGIVANFIHSMDGRHLSRTMSRFKLDGGTSFGSIHDCFIARPSEMHVLNYACREAFWAQYQADPLNLPVRLRALDGKVESFDSWYALASSFGVAFPDMGKWQPEEVLKSAWFFS